jgi:hypothetical protein
MTKNLYSPTMLKNYLSCQYIIYNEKNEKNLRLAKKERTASDAARLNKGNEHEKIVFNELKKKFKNVTDIKNKKISREEKISETLKAMKEGAELSYCGFLNTASTPIAITITPVVAGVGTAVTAAFPTAGSSNNTIILGVSMGTPMVIAVPPIFQVTAIGTASSTLYVTPMVDQT